MECFDHAAVNDLLILVMMYDIFFLPKIILSQALLQPEIALFFLQQAPFVSVRAHIVNAPTRDNCGLNCTERSVHHAAA